MSAREGRSEEPVREENLPHCQLYDGAGYIGSLGLSPALCTCRGGWRAGGP